jgi:hypothetical protein
MKGHHQGSLSNKQEAYRVAGQAAAASDAAIAPVCARNRWAPGGCAAQGNPWNCKGPYICMSCAVWWESSQRFSSMRSLGLFKVLGLLSSKRKTSFSGAFCPATCSPWHRDSDLDTCLGNHCRGEGWPCGSRAVQGGHLLLLPYAFA